MNISLGLVALVLLLNLVGVNLPSLGKALYSFEVGEPVCVFSYQGDNSLVPMDLCCSELPLQLVKGEKSKEFLLVEGGSSLLTKKYYTSESTGIYFINNKAYLECKINGFDV